MSALLNKYSRENGSNTPDFILAEYMHGALELFDATTAMREKWYGREPKMIGTPDGELVSGLQPVMIIPPPPAA